MAEQDWCWTMRVNRPRDFRQVASELLHKLAERIDGRPYAAYDIKTSPAISRGKIVHSINLSFKATQKLIEDEARSEAEEIVLRKILPELYRG